MSGIAIIGMAGRFPGAGNIDAFWRNIAGGVESIRHFSCDELREAGIDETLLSDPSYVKARAVLDKPEWFDAAFFGFQPREAEITDPQHRVFLETAWEALENAGCDPERFTGPIGVFAGASLNTYLLANLCRDRKFIEEMVTGFQTDGYQLLVGNDKDYLATRVSYKLNLRGPSVTVQTACSTSLTAVSMACQSLLTYQCDAALAGGVSISFPQARGYRFQDGAIGSDDGHCRAFDEAARGTVFGSGVGIVVLKRLDDAIANGDHISAVIQGFGLNNDGSAKVSYMAPSVGGQAEAVALAQSMAGFDPGTITYVETHGTATPLGDPIEIAALTQAFRAGTQARKFCAIGSVKTNVGHLESAAGVASLIKTALALEHRQIPPSLFFKKPNPKIDFENSPFYVNTELKEWKRADAPRRAGVSSFGVGGTNAHLVLEEAPASDASPSLRPAHLLVLSAHTPSALDAMSKNLAAHLRANPALPVSDAAYTLQTGRRAFTHRRAVVCAQAVDAAENLEKPGAPIAPVTGKPEVAFLFPGQGAQYVNMGLELYRTEPVFREELDRCAEILKPILGLDLRTLLYPRDGDKDESTRKITQTSITQPALFAIEYALARLWMSWGIRPAAIIGHSVGEYVAACLAGVFTLEDGLGLISARARLMQALPPGSMLAVRMPENKTKRYLSEQLSLAAVNGPSLCVVSGPKAETEKLEARLVEGGIVCKFLHTSHAFHSAMMEPILAEFEKIARRVKMKPASIRMISTMTGDWMEPEAWANPEYWVRQLRQTVRFADAAGRLVVNPNMVLLEVGPGQTLGTLTQQHPDKRDEQISLSSMPPSQKPHESATILAALGRLWSTGASIDWKEFHRREKRCRVPLPTYPFERQRHWVEPKPLMTGEGAAQGTGLDQLVSNQAVLIQRWSDAAPGNGNGHGPVEEILEEQLRVMSQQLEMLRSLPEQESH